MCYSVAQLLPYLPLLRQFCLQTSTQIWCPDLFMVQQCLTRLQVSTTADLMNLPPIGCPNSVQAVCVMRAAVAPVVAKRALKNIYKGILLRT